MVKVIDSIMGNGKTSWAIGFMNQNPQRRFVFITPFLKEAERIQEKCTTLRFKQPDDRFSKQADFKKLLQHGENIAMTHALFTQLEWTQSMYDQLRAYGYTLILDEVIEVVIPVSLSEADHKMLVDTEKIQVDDDGVVRWQDSEYTGEFSFLKRMTKSKTLFRMEEKAYMWKMSIDMLKAFDEAYLLTFLFEGSHMKHYLDLHDIQCSLWHINDDRQLMPGRADLSRKKQEIRQLLDVYDGPLNKIGDEMNAFSKTWWKNGTRNDKTKVIVKNAYNFLRHECHAHSDDCMWSTFSNMKKRCSINGFAKGFCPCNARATNEFRDRKNLAYLVNVYEHPYVVKWFAQHGVSVDRDAFALSQLLQWIWRSAIRDNKPIKLYLPSKRMRTLLLDWLEDQ